MDLKAYAKWFFMQAGEEKEHAEKIADYLGRINAFVGAYDKWAALEKNSGGNSMSLDAMVQARDNLE